MHLDDEERRALAHIEASLTDNDPTFSRSFRRTQRFLPPRWPSLRAVGVSGLLLLAAAGALAAAAVLPQPLLVITGVALLLLAAVPIAVSVRGSSRGPGHREPWLRSIAEPVEDSHERLDVTHAVVVATDGRADGDAALRFAVMEAELRAADLVVAAAYSRPVDPDLDEIETPDHELRARTRRTVVEALCRALRLAEPDLPDHQIALCHGRLDRVLLTEFGEAELVIVAAPTSRRRPLRGLPRDMALLRDAGVPVVAVPPSWT